VALVTVLQRAENLTDRPAAEAVRTRIDWQPLGNCQELTPVEPTFERSETFVSSNVGQARQRLA